MLSREEAYRLAQECSTLEHRLEEVANIIRHAAQRGEFSAVLPLDEDIRSELRSYGYRMCVALNDDTMWEVFWS